MRKNKKKRDKKRKIKSKFKIYKLIKKINGKSAKIKYT